MADSKPEKLTHECPRCACRWQQYKSRYDGKDQQEEASILSEELGIARQEVKALATALARANYKIEILQDDLESSRFLNSILVVPNDEQIELIGLRAMFEERSLPSEAG